MATLGMKEMGNFFGKVGKKVCPVGCLSLVNLVFHFGVGRHASFPQKPVVKVVTLVSI